MGATRSAKKTAARPTTRLERDKRLLHLDAEERTVLESFGQRVREPLLTAFITSLPSRVMGTLIMHAQCPIPECPLFAESNPEAIAGHRKRVTLSPKRGGRAPREGCRRSIPQCDAFVRGPESGSVRDAIRPRDCVVRLRKRETRQSVGELLRRVVRRQRGDFMHLDTVHCPTRGQQINQDQIPVERRRRHDMLADQGGVTQHNAVGRSNHAFQKYAVERWREVTCARVVRSSVRHIESADAVATNFRAKPSRSLSGTMSAHEDRSCDTPRIPSRHGAGWAKQECAHAVAVAAGAVATAGASSSSGVTAHRTTSNTRAVKPAAIAANGVSGCP